MHALQVLAVLAWLLSRSGLPRRRQTQLVTLAVVGYAGLFGVALGRTTSGLAPVALLDAWTLGYLLAAGLLAAPAVTAVAAHRPPRTDPVQPPGTIAEVWAAQHRQGRLDDPTRREGEERCPNPSASATPTARLRPARSSSV